MANPSYSERWLAALAGVAPDDISSYLLAHGWEEIASKLPSVALFRRDAGTRVQVAVPKDRSFPDFGHRLADLMAHLAEVEKREVEEVVLDLLRPASDTLKFRLSTKTTADGTVPLVRGLSLLNNTKKALLATACSVIEPRVRIHPRMALAEAGRFLDACRLGQTEEGSFVATFVCPLDVPAPGQNASQIKMFSEHDRAGWTSLDGAFGRKVSRLLMQSLDHVKTALETDRPETLVTPDESAPSLTVNLCEALSEMVPEEPSSSLELSCHWASALPETTTPRKRVTLGSELLPALQSVTSSLRASAGPRHDMFIGKVPTLSGKPNEAGRVAGDVYLSIIEKDRIIRARVALAPDDYEIAWRAHHEDRYVKVTGTLESRNRVHILAPYIDFDFAD